MGRSSNDGVSRNWSVAVVGAGPAGLYGADALLKAGARVDVFERQFAPFGLLRYGVAPDHQKIKKTEKVFTRTLDKPGLRFFGGVEVGKDVHMSELLELYDQVLLTYGSSGARRLNIPGIDQPGCWSATEFVGWYNGHPDFLDRAPPLDGETAVVVGMGNVAVDVARILLRDRDALAVTDIADPALEVLRRSRIRDVHLLARRGPNQAAFDIKEVRELAACEGIEVQVEGYVSKRPTPLSDFIRSFPRKQQATGKRRVILTFCASPKAVLGEERVESITVERNTLVESAARIKAVGTGETWELPCDLLVRAVGYHGVMLPGVPFSEETGTVPNDAGRVLTEHHGKPVAGLYVAGWIKRGPTGLLGRNKSCAVETVRNMEDDLNQMGPLRDPGSIVSLLEERSIRWVSLEDWRRLDEFEREGGRADGRPRRKLLSRTAAWEALNKATTPR